MILTTILQVQFTKCMRCQAWGHSHTDRSCPMFGKAKDHEEPIHPVDQKKLFSDLESQGMKFTSYGAWDNGKMGEEGVCGRRFDRFSLCMKTLLYGLFFQ